MEQLTLNQRVPGSSPGAPTISTEKTDTYEDRPQGHLDGPTSGHTGVTDRPETHHGYLVRGAPKIQFRSRAVRFALPRRRTEP